MSKKICGTKSRAKQHTKYTDSLNNFVMRKESPNNELIRRTDNREDWKALITDVCNRPGTDDDDDANIFCLNYINVKADSVFFLCVMNYRDIMYLDNDINPVQECLAREKAKKVGLKMS